MSRRCRRGTRHTGTLHVYSGFGLYRNGSDSLATFSFVAFVLRNRHDRDNETEEARAHARPPFRGLFRESLAIDFHETRARNDRKMRKITPFR